MNSMPTSIPADSTAAVFRLPPTISIETAAVLQQQLSDLLRDHSELTLDGSDVTFITTPGIQLLVSVQKTLAARGGVCAVHACSGTLQAALTLGGFSALMQPMEAQHA